MKREIIHKLIYHKDLFEKNKEGRLRKCHKYLCNQAVKPKSNKKYNLQWRYVTCKNCLKQKHLYISLY